MPSSAKIVYLWINNLNYRFLQLTFLFYCNIFYKTKTVATCSYRLLFIPVDKGMPLSFDLDFMICEQKLFPYCTEYCKIFLGLLVPEKMTFFSFSGKE